MGSEQAASGGAIEYRDVRPGGAAIASWLCAPGAETGYGYAPGFWPSPPWERQRREPGGEWTTVAIFSEDGSVETRRPDGAVLVEREWRE